MKGNFSGPFSPTTRIVFFFFSSSFSTPKKNESSETDPWQLPSGQSQTPAPPRFLTGQENELLDDVVVDCNFFATFIISTREWNGVVQIDKNLLRCYNRHFAWNAILWRFRLQTEENKETKVKWNLVSWTNPYCSKNFSLLKI